MTLKTTDLMCAIDDIMDMDRIHEVTNMYFRLQVARIGRRERWKP